MRKSTEERREEIADALLTVMSKHGYARATIQRISAEADLSPGLVHYHFKTKQEILIYVVERLSSRLEPRLATRLGDVDDPVQELKRFVDCYLRSESEDDRVAVRSWVTITAEAIRQEEVQEAFESALQRMALPLADIIERGIALGVFSPVVSTQTVTAAVLAGFQGWFNLGVSARSIIPSGTAADAMHEMMAGLLRCPDLARRE